MADTKPIRFTRHAKNRMRWRKIAEEDVRLSIIKPEFIEKSELGDMNAWIRVSDQYLRTTYREEQDTIVVISVVKKRALPKE
jgi:CRISPR/Cas system CSM-associated protein Csm5 (group 7 of RAMP superfamily)